MISIDDFSTEKKCNFKGELYSARDNGAVLRHSREGKRIRKHDNIWTFGKENPRTNYLEIASVSVHRIVATAFNGEEPAKNYVVDHIDTNKHNNRPENLRWVTRLENILLNPITLSRIEYVCECSIDEFLADPKKYSHKFSNSNYSWMRTVSKEEANNSLKRMLAWTKDTPGSRKGPSRIPLGEWVYSRENVYQESFKNDIYIESLTLNAIQKNWKIPSEFPCCPVDPKQEPISTYFSNLEKGKVFSKNNIITAIVKDFAISEDKSTIWVVCETDGTKKWALAKVNFDNDSFVHKSLGTYFKEDGVEKYYTLAQGLEWTGGEVFDDQC